MHLKIVPEEDIDSDGLPRPPPFQPAVEDSSTPATTQASRPDRRLATKIAKEQQLIEKLHKQQADQIALAKEIVEPFGGDGKYVLNICT